MARQPRVNYPPCIFCGAPSDSREHAIPKWMSKRLGIKAMLGNRSQGLIPRRHMISFANHRARILCQPCNEHFGRLEEEAMPLLIPMANGRVLSLATETRALLALWAAKTAIMLIAERHELRTFVPKGHRDSVRYANRPHSNVWVGFVPWASEPSVFVGDNKINLPAGGSPIGYTSYTVIFGFKGAAFQVVAIEPLLPGYHVGVDGYSVEQFWPVSGSGFLSWPLTGPPARESDIPLMARFGPLLPD